MSRNNNIFKINHSAFKSENVNNLDNLFNINVEKLPIVIKN